VWLIQIALIIVATITLLLAGTIVGLVLFVPTILLAVAEYTTPAVVTGIIAGLILLPLVIVAAAALSTFNHAYWTLTYLRISGRDLPSSRRVVSSRTRGNIRRNGTNCSSTSPGRSVGSAWP
jgi:hypothetical protein